MSRPDCVCSMFHGVVLLCRRLFFFFFFSFLLPRSRLHPRPLQPYILFATPEPHPASGSSVTLPDLWIDIPACQQQCRSLLSTGAGVRNKGPPGPAWGPR
jgi:hypothetical protein